MKKEIKLNEKELTILQSVFGNSIDYSKVKIYSGGIWSYKSTRTVGNSIYFQEDYEFEKYRDLTYIRSILIHEFVHIWQYQNFGWKYAFGSLFDQLISFIFTGERNGAYRYTLEENKKLIDYGFEQQAQIIQDYWLIEYCDYIHTARMFCKNFEVNEKIFNIYRLLYKEIFKK